MIDLKSEGYRISRLGGSDFLPNDPIIIERDDMKLRGRIRWISAGAAGNRLDRLLLSRELDAHLSLLRNLEGPADHAVGPNEQATHRRAG